MGKNNNFNNYKQKYYLHREYTTQEQLNFLETLVEYAVPKKRELVKSIINSILRLESLKIVEEKEDKVKITFVPWLPMKVEQKWDGTEIGSSGLKSNDINTSEK